MDKRISGWLRRLSTGWMTLAALLIFLLFSILVLPQQATRAEQATGSPDSPDTSFFYSASDLYRMAEAYGQQGRQAYVRARFTFDLVWPLVYTLFLATAISWILGRTFGPDSPWQRANLAPLLGALFDYLENLSTSLVMLRYPAQTAVVDRLAPLFTALKWSLIGASFALLFGGIGAAIWRWIKHTVRARASGPGGPDTSR
ncbi:MAG: hypothetical protein JSV81_16575 [Anaerolineales bacterium]|nr:MAG: hypothetical protein JSV81_16575 [Anaerolineales bacterium]